MTALGRLNLATALAGLIVAIVVTAVVLPVEVGVDPLGSGEWLGISRSVDPEVHQAQTGTMVTDEVRFVLDPYQSIEYKYRVVKGRTFVYDWKATGDVVFEFHGEIDGRPEGEAATYQIGRADRSSGRFTAPADGVHGWYWQNRTFEAVTVALVAAGFIESSLTLSRSGVVERPLTPRPER